MEKTQGPLDKLYWYGGELRPLADIIEDLQRIALNQAWVDRYVQGLQSGALPIFKGPDASLAALYRARQKQKDGDK